MTYPQFYRIRGFRHLTGGRSISFTCATDVDIERHTNEKYYCSYTSPILQTRRQRGNGDPVELESYATTKVELQTSRALKKRKNKIKKKQNRRKGTPTHETKLVNEGNAKHKDKTRRHTRQLVTEHLHEQLRILPHAGVDASDEYPIILVHYNTSSGNYKARILHTYIHEELSCAHYRDINV